MAIFSRDPRRHPKKCLVRNFVFFKSSKKSALTYYSVMRYGDFYRTLKFSHEKTVIFTRLRGSNAHA